MSVKIVIRHLLLIVITTAVLSGCGFHLRDAKTLPSNMDYLYVVSSNQNAPLIKALQTKMSVYRINGGTSAEPGHDNTTIELQLKPEKLDRRLLSVFATGQVAEYELIYSVRYIVVFPDGFEVRNQFEVLRDYQDDPDQVLAKSRELNLVLSEMRLEAADRIIRLLSSQYPQA